VSLVCAEKLIGAAQKITLIELEDPILGGIDKNDPVARNSRILDPANVK
jgi:hypothetical protein